jgi:hypothetical protein
MIPAKDHERLGKLLNMLTSEHDSEVLTAARRIVATLASHKLLPENLLGLRGEPSAARPAPSPQPPPRPQPAPKPAGPARSSAEEAIGPSVNPEPAHIFAAKILSFSPRLPETGRQFLEDLIRRRQIRLTDKQTNFIRDLAEKTIRQLKQHRNEPHGRYR